jgi:putative transposase
MLNITPAPLRTRPHRLPRACYRGHVIVATTACIEDRKLLFTEAGVVAACVELLSWAAPRFQCTVPIYCFMPEHLHLLLRGASSTADAWAAMAAFKQRSGFWMAANRLESKWQKDYWDHIVRRDEDLRAHIRYIANNPVRRGLAAEWDEYPFTGAIGHDMRELVEGEGWPNS